MADEVITIKVESKLSPNIDKNFDKVESGARKAKLEVLKLRSAEERFAQLLSRGTAAANRNAAAHERRVKALKKTAISARRAAQATAGLTRTLKTLFIFATARELVRLTDAYTNMANRLRLVARNGEEVIVIQRRLFELANRSRTPIEDVTVAFQRFDLALKDLGASQQESLRFTETLSKQLSLSGLSTMEAAQGLRQLSQALNKGKLDGDEFRTVMETIPTVSSAIAKELGVARGALLDLAPTGVITSEVIRNAISNIAQETDDAFNKTQKTVGQAFTVLRNKTIEFIGGLNSATGVAGKFADVIILVAKNIDIAAASLAGFGVAGALFLVKINPVVSVIAGVSTALFLLRDNIKVTSGELITLGDVGKASFSFISDSLKAFKSEFEDLVLIAQFVGEKLADGFVALVKVLAKVAKAVPAFLRASFKTSERVVNNIVKFATNKLKSFVKFQVDIIKEVIKFNINAINKIPGIEIGIDFDEGVFKSINEKLKESKITGRTAGETFIQEFINGIEGDGSGEKVIDDFFGDISTLVGGGFDELKKEILRRSKELALARKKIQDAAKPTLRPDGGAATSAIKKQTKAQKEFNMALRDTLSLSEDIQILRDIGQDELADQAQRKLDILNVDKKIATTLALIRKLEADGFADTKEAFDLENKRQLLLEKRKSIVAAPAPSSLPKRTDSEAREFGLDILSESKSPSDILFGQIEAQKDANQRRLDLFDEFNDEQKKKLEKFGIDEARITKENNAAIDKIHEDFEQSRLQKKLSSFSDIATATGNFTNELAELFKKGNKDGEKENKAAFLAYKSFALATAVIQTAAGVTNALSQPTGNPFLNFANAAAVGVAGGVQIGTILAENFANGGFVSGRGTGRSDDIPANLSNGEFVMNAAATRANRGLLEQMNSNSFGSTVNTNQTVVNNTPAPITNPFNNGGSNTSSSVELNIFNSPGLEAEVVETDSDEGKKIDVYIKKVDEALAANLSNNIGPLAQGINNRIQRKF